MITLRSIGLKKKKEGRIFHKKIGKICYLLFIGDKTRFMIGELNVCFFLISYLVDAVGQPSE